MNKYANKRTNKQTNLLASCLFLMFVACCVCACFQLYRRGDLFLPEGLHVSHDGIYRGAAGAHDPHHRYTHTVRGAVHDRERGTPAVDRPVGAGR